MKTYTVEIRDSDGNDCKVYDVVVAANSAEEARDHVFDWALENSPKGTEEDGDYGAYYSCDSCNCESENCEGHGGFSVGEASEGDTSSKYHSRVRL